MHCTHNLGGSTRQAYTELVGLDMLNDSDQYVDIGWTQFPFTNLDMLSNPQQLEHITLDWRVMVKNHSTETTVLPQNK